MKFLKLFYLIVFFSGIFCQFSFANKPKQKTELVKAYSFRPLLIQGEKKLNQTTKEMKVETGAITESEVIFMDIDFKKQIFLDAGIQE